RIVWMSKERLRVESSVTLPPGASVSLSGALADAIGEQHISMTVLEAHRSHLQYRYSEAVVSTWNVSQNAKRRAAIVVSGHSSTGIFGKCRVYVVAKSLKLRDDLIAMLDNTKFDI